MDSTPPKLKGFARRLLTHDAGLGAPGRAHPVETFQLFEKLRAPLVQLSGAGGFRSLLSRSLALASGDVPWLRALHIRADGSLEGLKEVEGKLSAEEIALGEVALAVRFIGLLVIFIGPTLTLQLLQDIWPKMDELTF
jgi:hypothetical protein